MTSCCLPKIRGEIKKARHVGYDFYSSVFEFIDNALDTDCHHIRVEIKEKTNHGMSRINKIIVSDDFQKGIPESILTSIFSWTFEKQRMTNHIGEYGTGFKSASVNLGNMLTVYTFDPENGVYLKAVADWDEMEETDRWSPKVVIIDEPYYRDYHPFDRGTSFVVENVRQEFFPNQKSPSLLFQDLCQQMMHYYKYYLRQHPEKRIVLRGPGDEGERIEKTYSCGHEEMEALYTDRCEIKMESRINVYKDQVGFLNFFIQKHQQNKIEIVEFVEKRKNGNDRLRCAEVSHRILASMTLIDEIVFRTTSTPERPGHGLVDMIQNNRMVGKDFTFRKPRQDHECENLKHEVFFHSKHLHAIMGVGHNKRNTVVANDLFYTMEYVQCFHEKEMIRLCNQKATCSLVHEKPKSENPIKNEIITIPELIVEKPVRPPKRRNFTLETKLKTIKKQESRDSDFDFLLKDYVLPMDYDHKSGRNNNSEDNCQALSVISHALKTRHPEVYEKILSDKQQYIIDLLNCLTSSKIFLNLYKADRLKILPADDVFSITQGIFVLQESTKN